MKLHLLFNCSHLVFFGVTDDVNKGFQRSSPAKLQNIRLSSATHTARHAGRTNIRASPIAEQSTTLALYFPSKRDQCFKCIPSGEFFSVKTLARHNELPWWSSCNLYLECMRGAVCKQNVNSVELVHLSLDSLCVLCALCDSVVKELLLTIVRAITFPTPRPPSPPPPHPLWPAAAKSETASPPSSPPAQSHAPAQSPHAAQ